MSQFDVEGKPRAWHTAFFYLAEHVRQLTGGSMNHKGLYALVGTEGRYLNHANPTVRKRTAGALSRIVHSQRYAKDMRDQYLQSYSTFARASAEVCGLIREVQGWDDARLADCLHHQCWPDVREGLSNERFEWRGDIRLSKVDIEMTLLFATLESSRAATINTRIATGSETDLLGANTAERDASEVIFGTMLYLLAFGNLNASFARSLFDEYPTGVLEEAPADDMLSYGACLVKFVDEAHSALVGTWTVKADHPFTIGRYTDCDIVETDAGISRTHCLLYHMGGSWKFEDRGSRNGSRVERNGEVVYDSARDGADQAVELQHGDSIVLANRSHYWFGAMAIAAPFSVP